MSVRATLLVAGKELRETLRDRRTLAVMFLFPLVVYPIVSLVMAQVIADRAARSENAAVRISVDGPPALAGDVRARLAASGANVITVPPAPVADVASNRLDALVEIAPGTGTQPPAVRVYYDETRETSTEARDRVTSALAVGLGPGCAPAYAVAPRSVTPRSGLGSYVLAKILPLILIVMVMLGAFHPAIDITAGERERGTLETTLSAPVSRRALMAGKVVAVATLAALTGLLNLASISLTVFEGAHLVAGRAAFTMPWGRAAAALLVIPPTALLFASVMVAIGSMARSFKEAQTLLTPVYLLCMAPSMTAALGDFELRGAAVWLPGINVTLLARDLVAGRAHAPTALAVLVSTLAYAALALALAARLYDSERLIGGDDAGVPLRTWLARLVRSPRAAEARAANALPAGPASPTAGQALALYAAAWIVLLLFAPLEAHNLILGLLLFEWVGLGGLTVLYARGSGRGIAEALRIRRPTARALAGALLVGASAWIVVGLLADWILPVPKHVVEHLRHLVAPSSAERSLLVSVTLIALTPAICEEALFRGPILRGLATRFSPAGAAVLTGLLFGLYHADVWRFVPTAALGVVLSAVALRADSIVPAMLAHFLNNACLVLLARFDVDETRALPVAARLALIAFGSAILATGFALLRRRPSAPLHPHQHTGT